MVNSFYEFPKQPFRKKKHNLQHFIHFPPQPVAGSGALVIRDFEETCGGLMKLKHVIPKDGWKPKMDW